MRSPVRTNPDTRPQPSSSSTRSRARCRAAVAELTGMPALLSMLDLADVDPPADEARPLEKLVEEGFGEAELEPARLSHYRSHFAVQPDAPGVGDAGIGLIEDRLAAQDDPPAVGKKLVELRHHGEEIDAVVEALVEPDHPVALTRPRPGAEAPLEGRQRHAEVLGLGPKEAAEGCGDVDRIDVDAEPGERIGAGFEIGEARIKGGEIGAPLRLERGNPQ